MKSRESTVERRKIPKLAFFIQAQSLPNSEVLSWLMRRARAKEVQPDLWTKSVDSEKRSLLP